MLIISYTDNRAVETEGGEDHGQTAEAEMYLFAPTGYRVFAAGM